MANRVARPTSKHWQGAAFPPPQCDSCIQLFNKMWRNFQVIS